LLAFFSRLTLGHGSPALLKLLFLLVIVGIIEYIVFIDLFFLDLGLNCGPVLLTELVCTLKLLADVDVMNAVFGGVFSDWGNLEGLNCHFEVRTLVVEHPIFRGTVGDTHVGASVSLQNSLALLHHDGSVHESALTTEESVDG
jgi:hypothetical protein